MQAKSHPYKTERSIIGSVDRYKVNRVIRKIFTFV